ncbi:hypothetical protein NPIL_270661 [Nephila pilipes]|uniref:Uncharacterized protein n=1 Tax=Nephila pilipes TaxID=299642 RepID=A0A8X6IBV1_NEPPI|nr:hypothetical protein NPIL_270661 [Nephila pilipes]
MDSATIQTKNRLIFPILRNYRSVAQSIRVPPTGTRDSSKEECPANITERSNCTKESSQPSFIGQTYLNGQLFPKWKPAKIQSTKKIVSSTITKSLKRGWRRKLNGQPKPRSSLNR